jgi:hypothetical protein
MSAFLLNAVVMLAPLIMYLNVIDAVCDERFEDNCPSSFESRDPWNYLARSSQPVNNHLASSRRSTDSWSSSFDDNAVNVPPLSDNFALIDFLQPENGVKYVHLVATDSSSKTETIPCQQVRFSSPLSSHGSVQRDKVQIQWEYPTVSGFRRPKVTMKVFHEGWWYQSSTYGDFVVNREVLVVDSDYRSSYVMLLIRTEITSAGSNTGKNQKRQHLVVLSCFPYSNQRVTIPPRAMTKFGETAGKLGFGRHSLNPPAVSDGKCGLHFFFI